MFRMTRMLECCALCICRPNSILRLRFEHFATECSWDHLYVYDGDSIYSPLLAAFRYWGIFVYMGVDVSTSLSVWRSHNQISEHSAMISRSIMCFKYGTGETILSCCLAAHASCIYSQLLNYWHLDRFIKKKKKAYGEKTAFVGSSHTEYVKSKL